MQNVTEFLIKNGLLYSGERIYSNDKCTVTIDKDFYSVIIFNKDFEYGFMYSQDLNIYWLIGVLTYYNLIDRNYKE